MFQQIVGHGQDGLGGTVVLFQPDDARAGEKLGEIQDVADIGPAKGINGLGLVPHGHDVARSFAFRPGQQADDAGLDEVGVLILIHEDMPVARTQELRRPRILPQERLQLEQQIVVVHDARFPPEGVIAAAQLRQAVGVGQQMEGLALEDLSKGHLLVAGLAQQAHDGLRLGEGPVALAQAQFILAAFDGSRDVRAVHDRKGPVAEPLRPEPPQDAVGEGVERAALHPGQRMVTEQARPVQHLLRGLTGEGQQEHGFRGHALFGQPGQPVGDGARLAAARAGHHQHRAVATGGGRILRFIERFGVIDHPLRLA